MKTLDMISGFALFAAAVLLVLIAMLSGSIIHAGLAAFVAIVATVLTIPATNQ